MGKTDNPHCPVVEVVAYMVTRGSSPGAFVLKHKQKPHSKQRFIRKLREALVAVGVDQSSFAGHSFQIGVATAASQAGFSVSTIETLGRWSSAAFLTYIRTPRCKFTSLTSNFRYSGTCVSGHLS